MGDFCDRLSRACHALEVVYHNRLYPSTGRGCTLGVVVFIRRQVGTFGGVVIPLHFFLAKPKFFGEAKKFGEAKPCLAKPNTVWRSQTPAEAKPGKKPGLKYCDRLSRACRALVVVYHNRLYPSTERGCTLGFFFTHSITQILGISPLPAKICILEAF